MSRGIASGFYPSEMSCRSGSTSCCSATFQVFGLAAVTASVACFELAAADPIELAPVFVVTALRNRAGRGRVHRATIVRVFEHGVLALTIEDGLMARNN